MIPQNRYLTPISARKPRASGDDPRLSYDDLLPVL